MALPAPTLGAQPTDVLRLLSGYLGVRDGAFAAGALPKLDQFTTRHRRRLQEEQWGWLLPGMKTTSFSEMEAMLKRLGASTVDLSTEEQQLWRAAVESLKETPSPLSSQQRADYIQTTFPIFDKLVRRSCSRPDPLWDRYFQLLHPEQNWQEAPGVKEVALRIPLVRLALVEGSTATVLRTFLLDPDRYASNLGHHPNYTDLPSRVLNRDQPKWISAIVKGVDRNRLLTSLFIRGLCTRQSIEILPFYFSMMLPCQIPSFFCQALSVSGYDFLAPQNDRFGLSRGSMFAFWIERTFHTSPSDDDHSTIQVTIDWMTTMVDRLLVENKLEERSSEAGWAMCHRSGHNLLPEKRCIPLEEFLYGFHFMFVRAASTRYIYREVVKHLIERGVQVERLTTWLASNQEQDYPDEY